jgi:hypothetical protein
MEHDALGLHLAVFDVDFVAAQHDGDVFAHADQIAMPVWNVFVGDTGGDVEHDDGALALDVVAVAEAAELLLTGCVLKMRELVSG